MHGVPTEKTPKAQDALEEKKKITPHNLNGSAVSLRLTHPGQTTDV